MMSTMRTSPHHALTLAARIILAAVAVFWSWFAISVALTERQPAGYAAASALIVVLLALAIGSWFSSRWIGLGSIGAGAFAAVMFPSGAALALMSAPLILAGVLLLSGSRQAPADAPPPTAES